MVSQLDFQIGRVLQTLESRGLREDTLVLVTTDHGELLGHHQMIFKGPLHYDDLLRVPLIVNGPGFTAGEVRDDPVGTIDIAPTALQAAGIDLPDQLEGAPLQATGDREHTLTENDFDIVLKLRLRTLTTREWKVTRYEDTPEVGELYALAEDPEELVNRWDDPECASIRTEMLDALDATMNHDAHSEPKVGIVG
jgi:arylsulfatase A-like enzyme